MKLLRTLDGKVRTGATFHRLKSRQRCIRASAILLSSIALKHSTHLFLFYIDVQCWWNVLGRSGIALVA